MIPTNKVCCIYNDNSSCEYRGTYICKNPDCKTLVLTSTLPGAHPSGCPYYDNWNRKNDHEERSNHE